MSTFYCCYCKKEISGEAPYAIPEGFPDNPLHEGKPLCQDCGERPEPDLDVICHHLDVEFNQNALEEAKAEVARRLRDLCIPAALESVPPLVQKVFFKLITDLTVDLAIRSARLKALAEDEARAPDGTSTTIPLSVGDVTAVQVDFVKHESTHLRISDDEDKELLITATLNPQERKQLIHALGGKP